MSSEEQLFKDVETVIITGGSSGIGECFIRRIQTLKPQMAFGNLSRTEPAISFKESPIFHIPCDLSRREALESAAREAEKFARQRSGKIMLINNSGFGCYGPFPNPALEEHLEMIRVNVQAPVHLTGLLLPLLRERGGFIVNIASTSAFQPTPYMATYGASKAFLLHWSLSLGEDLKHDGVEVLAVCPGPTSTKFFRRAGFTQPVVSGRIGQTPDQVVDATFRALKSRKRVVVSGGLNKLLVSASSRLPKAAAARISEMVLRRFRLEKMG